MTTSPTPEAIMKLGTAFWASKTMLTAVELGLFTELAKEPLTAEQLRERTGLHPRAARDFFDALVALGMLERNSDRYANTVDTNTFLDRNKPSYVGGMLEMANARLYGFWGNLTTALKTGEPQNEIRGGQDLFAALYADPARLEGFLKAMSGVSYGAAMALAAKFPWGDYKTFVDVGAAQGVVPVVLGQKHPHLLGTGYDLAAVKPVFEAFVAQHQLSDRITFASGDFFTDAALPSTDVIVMGHILHDWDLDQKKVLLRKAHEALKPGGALVVYEALIDDDRRQNAFGLLMSLNMLIETPGGFDFTGAQCCEWMKETGFAQTRVEHLVGPDSMVVGIK